MALRAVFRCLERPPSEGLSAQSLWCEPPSHSTEFCYSLFGGQWGTWYHVHIALTGPKEWVFRPFVDKHEQLGSKGRMKYIQHHMPQGAKTGSVWECPNKSFKRVLSRGGAWENVQPGTQHPDERDHDDDQAKEPGPQTEQRFEDTEVSGGTGESAPGDGNDGQVSAMQQFGEENAGVGLPTAEHPAGTSEAPESLVNPASLETVEIPKPDAGEGVDANGSPVV